MDELQLQLPKTQTPIPSVPERKSIKLDGFTNDLTKVAKTKITLKGKKKEDMSSIKHFVTLYDTSRDQTQNTKKDIIPPRFFFHDMISSGWWEVDNQQHMPMHLQTIPSTTEVYKTLSSPKFVPSSKYTAFSDQIDNQKIKLVEKKQYDTKGFLIKNHIDGKYYTLGSDAKLKKIDGPKHIEYEVDNSEKSKDKITVCILDTSMWVTHVKDHKVTELIQAASKAVKAASAALTKAQQAAAEADATDKAQRAATEAQTAAAKAQQATAEAQQAAQKAALDAQTSAEPAQQAQQAAEAAQKASKTEAQATAALTKATDEATIAQKAAAEAQKAATAAAEAAQKAAKTDAQKTAAKTQTAAAAASAATTDAQNATETAQKAATDAAAEAETYEQYAVHRYFCYATKYVITKELDQNMIVFKWEKNNWTKQDFSK